MNTPEVVTLPSRLEKEVLKVELRWGINYSDIEGIWALHDTSFPIRYTTEYYDWLMSESCIAVVAYATPSCVASATRGVQCEGNRAGTGVSDEYYKCDTSDEVRNAHYNDDGVCNGECSTGYTVPVGFCIGQIAYKQRRDGQFVVSPTGYLGSFAVDVRLRRRGLGELLLKRFLTYMFFKIPILPHFFLDYHLTELMSRGENKKSTSLWNFADSNFIMRLISYCFENKGTKAMSEPVVLDMERNDHTQATPTSDATTSSRNNSNICGLTEVWLHCLADDTKLVSYYLSRGFICAQLKPHFYTFDGLFHDGMMLVCSRETFCSKTDAVIGSVCAAGNDGTNNSSLSPEMALKLCTTTNSKEGVEKFVLLGESDADIVDVELEVDKLKLLKRLCTDDGGDVSWPTCSRSWAGGLPCLVKAVLIASAGVWLATVGL